MSENMRRGNQVAQLHCEGMSEKLYKLSACTYVEQVSRTHNS